MLELLVHFAVDDMPTSYQLLEIEISHEVTPIDLPLTDTWQVDPQSTRNAFEQFCIQKESVAARVPSVIMPECHNILLNPEHQNITLCTISKAIKAPIDSRLFA